MSSELNRTPQKASDEVPERVTSAALSGHSSLSLMQKVSLLCSPVRWLMGKGLATHT